MTSLRLNLGCGLQAPEGWINVDRSPNLLLNRAPLAKKALRFARVLQPEHMVDWPKNITMFNVLRRFPYADGEVEAVYSSHMLEHLFYDQALQVLRECHRVLRSGEVIRLALPDAEGMARKLIDNSADAGSGMAYAEDLAMQPLRAPSRKQRLVESFASAPHRWQPTSSLVLGMLHETGFSDARRCSFRSGRLPDLASVEHREQSLFVEAGK